MLDTLILVETPEGISLRLRAAGVLPRAAAWAIDLAVRGGVLWVLGMALALLGETGVGLYLLVLFALFWLYPVLFEMLRDGQTIGKKALGLRVIRADGSPVTWMASIVRNLLRVVDMLPFCYGFGVVSGLLDARGRRIGDVVAGTLVVHTEHAPARSAAAQVPLAYPPLPLSTSEQMAVVAFAERTQQLTLERQQELADLLPMLTQTRGALAVQRLLGMANAFLGRHG